MSVETKPAGIGLLLCDDLIFSSRIAGTARDLGLVMKQAKTVDQLMVEAVQECPRCVIVDLSNETLTIARLIQHLRESCSPMPRL